MAESEILESWTSTWQLLLRTKTDLMNGMILVFIHAIFSMSMGWHSGLVQWLLVLVRSAFTWICYITNINNFWWWNLNLWQEHALNDRTSATDTSEKTRTYDDLFDGNLQKSDFGKRDPMTPWVSASNYSDLGPQNVAEKGKNPLISGKSWWNILIWHWPCNIVFREDFFQGFADMFNWQVTNLKIKSRRYGCCRVLMYHDHQSCYVWINVWWPSHRSWNDTSFDPCCELS